MSLDSFSDIYAKTIRPRNFKLGTASPRRATEAYCFLGVNLDFQIAEVKKVIELFPDVGFQEIFFNFEET